ncbi:bifunctional metallophosphatase/5'-nucleotidase [Deinococcus psychrotolerans]|uniref:Bifunctional metallophosphatase/5'-nucleotidase n=1 Tax=Deinococcus psychrotolerans TaxID=2489213 RepID=A0A3G8YAU3_9DEIO|nr:bifunctional metallophosphatase/5'-nucleotidase [Deinococcus psychrotolerans]AZI42509.1 bifunctional metallophosphatase/5'-nucleotidase [Deinococcus psychrotolerans]
MIKPTLALLTSALLLSACTTTTTNTTTPKTPDPVNITILGLNDFHGNLEPTSFTKVGDTAAIKAGGVAAIASEVNDAKLKNPNTILVGGGDLIGASPATSSLLRDEPSVVALNKIGMQISALGNHEFDQGLKELFRMQNGGCDSNDAAKACKFDPTFDGAKFKWIGANVEYNASSGKTGTPFAPYIIQDIGGAKIAFIGAVTKSVTGLVSPDGIKDLNFLDEAASINKYIPEIKAKNVDAIIMLIHEGGEISKDSKDTYATVGCKTLDASSPIVAIAKKVDPAVSAIISGHSHQGYNCLVPDPTGKDRIVIQGDFYGHLLQTLNLTVDKANHKPLSVSAANLVVDYTARETNKTLNADMLALVDKAKAKTDAVKAVPVANLGVPQIQRGISNARNTESALGDVIADAQVFATLAQGTQISLMNPGGIRQDLPDTGQIKAGNAINFGDVYAVQPFGNTLVVIDMTGQQIKDVLEQQWMNENATAVKLLQVSEGFSYKYTDSAPAGSKINIADIMFGGKPIDPAAKYRVAINSFLATGGDFFSVFTKGTNKVELPNLVDVDALNVYLKAKGSTLDGKVKGRITKL